MMRLELSQFVESDLDDIAAFIAQDNPQRAVTFIQEIRSKFVDIQRNPLIYRLRSDIGETARMATVDLTIPNFAYCARDKEKLQSVAFKKVSASFHQKNRMRISTPWHKLPSTRKANYAYEKNTI
jgi:plasmid stabilization system protein ParE